MSKVRPLLIFDSGVGGLSVLRPIRALLAAAPIVYVADSAGYPYGTKSEAEIAARVPALLGRLAERFDPELVVIACNTASTTALDAAIAARVPAPLGPLPERFHPEPVLLACNPAPAIALGAVRAALDLPIVGTVP